MGKKHRIQTRIISQNPSDAVVRVGLPKSSWSDNYHLLLTISWWGFLGLTCLIYIAANCLFALAYIAGGDCIKNATPGSFMDYFSFSVQTMATIGYGAMYPQTLYANMIVAIEALVGLLGVAMATGLMFARFARPTARVMFSRTVVVNSHNGVPTLMFRAANERLNQILEARMGAVLVRNETTAEGEFIRRFYDLKFTRNQSPIFAITWTAMHQIDESSPLYDMTLEALCEQEVEIVITLTGIDETFAQTVHARHSYIWQEIQWNAKFVDIVSRLPDGRRRIDYDRFHDTVST